MFGKCEDYPTEHSCILASSRVQMLHLLYLLPYSPVFIYHLNFMYQVEWRDSRAEKKMVFFLQYKHGWKFFPLGKKPNPKQRKELFVTYYCNGKDKKSCGSWTTKHISFYEMRWGEKRKGEMVRRQVRNKEIELF